MKKYSHLLVLLFIVLAFTSTLVGCGRNEQMATTTPAAQEESAEETATIPQPANTPVPTATLIPTATPLPTSVPAVIDVDAVVLEERRRVEDGGFSFQPLADFTLELNAGLAGLTSADEDIGIILAGGPVPITRPLEELMSALLGSLGEDIETGESYPISIDGVEGIAADLTGSLEGEAIEGRMALVAPTEEQLFFIFGGARNGRWSAEGAPLFEKVRETVTLFEPVPLVGELGDSDEATPQAVEPLAGVVWRYGGEAGQGVGQPGILGGVAFDEGSGRLYVADTNNGILVFDAEGKQLDTFTSGTRFFSASDVALGPEGHIYVANPSFDESEARIIVFSPEGEVTASFGTLGSGEGKFGPLSPASLAVAGDGTIFALDSNEDESGGVIVRIQRFTSEGTFLGSFVISPQEHFVTNNAPLAVDGEGNLYVPDFVSGTIVKLDLEGNVLTEILRDDGEPVGAPQGLHLDADGNIYLVVWETPSVLKLAPDGNVLATYGVHIGDDEAAWPEGTFYWPNSITATASGSRIFVSDWSGNYTFVTAFEFNQPGDGP